VRIATGGLFLPHPQQGFTVTSDKTNYSAAKMGLIGFMNTLKLEGDKHQIKVNTIPRPLPPQGSLKISCRRIFWKN